MPEGPTVTLSGTIRAPAGAAGPVRIDVFDGDQRDLSGPRPTVVAVARLSSPGAFTVEVPQSAGKVWLGAYLDENGDGKPGPGEAEGWFSGNPVTTDAAQGDLTLVLERGAPPPAGQ